MAARLRTLTVAGCVCVLLAYVWTHSLHRTTHGFVAYYAASRLLLAGELGPQIYDDPWFGAYVRSLTHTSVREVFGPNSPAAALLVAPLALAGHDTARTLWLVVSLASMVTALAAFTRQHPPHVPTGLLVVVLLQPSVFANLRTGQAYLVVFAMLAGGALALGKRRDLLAGALFGAAVALKSAGVAVLVLLAWKRRWRALLGAILAILAAVLLVWPFTGRAVWTAYPRYVRAFVARPTTAVTAYQSTVGFMRHMCVPEARWNAGAPVTCPAAAHVFPALLLAGALLLTLRSAMRDTSDAWMAAALSLSVLLVPLAAEEHAVLLGLPLLLLWGRGAFSPVMALVASALLMVPADLTIHRFSEGWLSLLAYPRLYAAWLLWGLAIRELRREASSQAGSTSTLKKRAAPTESTKEVPGSASMSCPGSTT